MVASKEPVRSVRGAAWRALVLPSLVLALARTADVHADAARWFGMRGPHCPLGSWLGACACPGCGLVRATALAAQGAFAQAWRMHPGGLAVAAVCAGAVLLQLDVLRRGSRLDAHARWQRLGRRTLAAGILLGWGVRIAVHASGSGGAA